MRNKKLFIFLAVILSVSMAGLGVTCAAPGEAPTLTLEVYDGPDYSESDGMCYYRIEGIATGMPEPEIEFADDDNVDSIGSGRVEVGVEIGDSYTLAATATNEDGTATASIVLGGDCSPGAAEESGPDAAVDSEADEDEDEDGEADGDGDGDADGDVDGDGDDDVDGEGQAPTISLEVYEGPFPVEDLCVNRVQANVTGSPSPAVTFSRDDSGGAWGTRKAQINLGDPGDTYTLTATATNSEGSATDSITLSWGCEEPEAGGDGDGDGDGDEDEETSEVTIFADPGISGWISEGGDVHAMSLAQMGDIESDEYIKGYFSFDIRSLHGKTVQDAYINFSDIDYYGNPSDWADQIIVKVFNYVRLDATDTRVGGTHIAGIPLSNESATITGSTLENELQNVLDNDVRDYFQIKLGLDVYSDDDGLFDAARIYCDNASLHIEYTD